MYKFGVGASAGFHTQLNLTPFLLTPLAIFRGKIYILYDTGSEDVIWHPRVKCAIFTIYLSLINYIYLTQMLYVFR